MQVIKDQVKDEQYPKIYLYQRVVRAKLFIDNNYSNKIELDNISDEACFSKFHFIRLFSSAYGKTPHQYLVSVRIEKARELLRAGQSVSDTCFSVGFTSPTSFSTLFKKITGVSPLQYQASQQQLQAKISQAPLAFVPGCYAYMHGWNENSNFEEAGL
ncbi:helix-turn-helix domain-containing protein [Chitinophaga barathri]|uniref:AraC family transcriptional regulator n=1 Tax=Chitinophaga barathri TaxID=1647451 RepID=A0A3N4M8Z1_9BACT|nr:AraC family transcriptional regulator [Chitinophaga barathri]RPD39951.1 AraC family transcriptional regulator [Chitinophaga barathri]